jgi:hypothetical protein
MFLTSAGLSLLAYIAMLVISMEQRRRRKDDDCFMWWLFVHSIVTTSATYVAALAGLACNSYKFETILGVLGAAVVFLQIAAIRVECPEDNDEEEEEVEEDGEGDGDEEEEEEESDEESHDDNKNDDGDTSDSSDDERDDGAANRETVRNVEVIYEMVSFIRRELADELESDQEDPRPESDSDSDYEIIESTGEGEDGSDTVS